jgi:hypothetical protein
MNEPYIIYQDVTSKLLGIDVSDMPELNDRIKNEFIPAAQAQIDLEVGHSIVASQMTRYYKGTGREQIVLMRRPVSSVESVTIYSLPFTSKWIEFKNICRLNTYDQFGNKICEEVPPTQTTDLMVDCARGVLQVPLTALTYAVVGTPINYPQFLPGNYNVKVAFTYGYPVDNMPRQVKDACAYLAAVYAIMAKGALVSKGYQSVRIGEMSTTFGPSATHKLSSPYAGLLAKYDENVHQLIAPFRMLGI